MCDYIIPDIFKIVLEYSSYDDRNAWQLPEDTGPIYEHVNIDNITADFIYGVTNITLTNSCSLPKIKLPWLKILNMQSGFSRPLHLEYLPSLIDLTVSNDYNEYLNLSAVPHLKRLHIGSKCNQNIDLSDIPNLEHLYLSPSYNQQLRLSHVRILTHLEMGLRHYNIDLSNLRNLIYLKLHVSSEFKFPIDISNLSLIELQLDGVTGQIDLSTQHRLTTLYIDDCDYTNIPQTVTTIHVSDFDRMYGLHVFDYNLEIKKLYISNRCTHLSLEHMPHLTHLHIGVDCNPILDLRSTVNLTSLHLGDSFTHKLIFPFGNKITNLHIGKRFQHAINWSSLPNLKTLYINCEMPAPAMFPCSDLTELHWVGGYVDISNLNKLTLLHLTGKYDQPLDLTNKTKLTDLKLTNNFKQYIDISNTAVTHIHSDYSSHFTVRTRKQQLCNLWKYMYIVVENN